jgi:hypothetical protein
MYIQHITLSTGHNARTSRTDVSDETLAVLVPWLNAGIESRAPQLLPVPQLSHYSAVAIVERGTLVCTIYGPPGPHMSEPPPLVTFGVAQRSRQGGELWDMLVGQFGAKPGLQKPSEPWCAVALHPSLAADPAVQWIGDLERCIAWAWITRNPAIDDTP